MNTSVRSKTFDFLFTALSAIILLITSLLPLAVQGQESVAALKRKREKLEEEIQLTAKLLEQTRQVKQESYTELQLLGQKIKLQERMIRAIGDEIGALDGKIDQYSDLRSAMEHDIEQYRKNYAKAAQTAYKRMGSESVLLWLFSSDSFTQAFERAMYFRAFSQFRKEQIRLIRSTQEALLRKVHDYKSQKAQKEMLLEQQVRQREKLDNAKLEQRKLFGSLKRQESRYKSQIRQYQQSLKKLKDEIADLIRKANEVQMTRAEQDKIFKLSNSFAKNKSRLPWPIPMPSAVLTGQFGQTKDASGGIVNNEGIYLSTSRGQAVRSVFEGTVTMITKIPSFGQVVIVQHGNYRSVYANLDKVFVEKGQQVETLQNLGTVRTEIRTGETQLYFQIYKDYDPINPEVWLAPK
jgi:septal ring factor EnvC (AmiA/AmiB activator)